jgi:microcystin-dependent protein
MKKLSWKLAVITAVTVCVMSLASPVGACGLNPFVGEICTFAFNFCPSGYLPADGRQLLIDENNALFALLGTTFGGDGSTTFALPDLRGRVTVGSGQGNGLSDIIVGQTGGTEQVTLDADHMPSHSHGATTTVNVTATLKGSSNLSNSATPTGNVLATQKNSNKTYNTEQANTNMGTSSISTVATAVTVVEADGGSQPIDIRAPYLGLSICIAVEGIFPSQ